MVTEMDEEEGQRDAALLAVMTEGGHLPKSAGDTTSWTRQGQDSPLELQNEHSLPTP